MFRRMLTAGLAPTALLAALAWTANATAKPPDLPLVDKDVLAPETPFVPAEANRSAQPNPFPIVAEPDARSIMEIPALLQMRPSARRMMASCLLFGAHPLLALAPTADYFDFDDDEVQTVAPAAFLAPVTSEAPTGSLLIGVGVDTDTGLTGSIDLTAPMAWSEIVTACWRMFAPVEGPLQPPADEPRGFINAFTPAGFIQGLSSDGELTTDLNIPTAPLRGHSGFIVSDEKSTADVPEQSACPWMRQLQCAPDRAGVLFTENDLFPDVMQNLTMLHNTQTLLQKARELGGEGRVVEALDCLDLAHALCPGNRFDAALQEAAVELFAPCYCGTPETASGGGGDVLSEPPAEKANEKKPADETKPFNTSRSTGREREIEMKLGQPATVIFKDEPLHQVIDDLRSWQNINITVDKAALDAEEISLDKTITIKLENVALQSAFHLILKQVHLTYVVKDGVVRITTERNVPAKVVNVSYESSDPAFTPCLPPVDPGTPDALDQLLHESEPLDPNAQYKRVEGVLDSGDEQEPQADMPRGMAKPFHKADGLEAVGCGKDAGSAMSCIEALSDFAATAHPGLPEVGLGLDGSIRMFAQLHRRGEIWHIVYMNGGLSVWAAPNGGADVETPAEDKPSD